MPLEMKGFQALTLSLHPPGCTLEGAREFRILVMGDSVIDSIGVEYEEAVAYPFERIANGSMYLSAGGYLGTVKTLVDVLNAPR